MSKHLKTSKPTDADLRGNPMIGGSKGVVRSQTDSADLEDSEGENTLEGDAMNDVNASGGLDKSIKSARPTDRH